MPQAHEQHLTDHALSVEAATALIPKSPVRFVGTSGLLADAVATCNVEPHGMTGAGTYAAGEIAAVYHDGNVVKARAAASVGAGAVVGVGSNNGAIGPVVAASGILKYALGISQTAAGAGEIFSVLIRPRLLSGQA